MTAPCPPFRSRAIVLALIVATLTPSTAHATPTSPSFTWTDVPGFNGKSACMALDLADDGSVVAECGTERFVVKNGAFRTLTRTDATTTYTTATPHFVSSTGWVGGLVTAPDGTRHYATWTPTGTLRTAPGLVAGRGTSLVGLTSRGDLAFNHATGDPATRTAHIWWADTNTVTKVPGVDASTLISSGALSDLGTYVGAEGRGPGTAIRPLAWTRGGAATHYTGFTATSAGSAQRISPDGRHIVGWSERTAGDTTTRTPVLFRHGGTPLPLPATPWDKRLAPLAINNSGAVLLAEGLISGGKAVQLSSVIAQLPPKTQVSAVDMDQHGRILAMFLRDGAYTMVLLTPQRS